MPPDNAQEPSAFAESTGGEVYLPTHALLLPVGEVVCNGVIFKHVDGPSWSLLEKLEYRDQEINDWMTHERTFAVMPFEGDATENSAIFGPVLEAYSAVVVAARLIAPGTWIDAPRIAAVARGRNGINRRLVGFNRPRLWSAVFGDPLLVSDRQRRIGERIECRPRQYQLPHGRAFIMDAAQSKKIEQGVAHLAQLGNLAPHHAWWTAHSAFQRGHDLFLPRRLRLTCLFSAFEIIFSPFRNSAGGPETGEMVAMALRRSGRTADETATYVEKGLRRVRNRLAHGSDLDANIDLAAVEENLFDFLRVGLNLSSSWIRGEQSPDGPITPGPTRTLIAFQHWLSGAR